MDEDMKQIRFIIPGQPFGKQRPKFSRAGAYVKTYTPKETTSYENLVKLFYNEALKKIAELAIQKKTGARGLRSIIESAMQKVMFDVPDMASAKRVVVTADCVEGKEDALVYGARNKKIA